jgi:hypothetical protein
LEAMLVQSMIMQIVLYVLDQTVLLF